MPTRSINALNVASVAILMPALALSLPVLERLSAAIWQWFKFAGSPDGGYINLSIGTGLFFSSILVATFLVALAINRFASRRGAAASLRLSLWAMYVVVAVGVSYWVLGVSSLNVWRA